MYYCLIVLSSHNIYTDSKADGSDNRKNGINPTRKERRERQRQRQIQSERDRGRAREREEPERE